MMEELDLEQNERDRSKRTSTEKESSGKDRVVSTRGIRYRRKVMREKEKILDDHENQVFADDVEEEGLYKSIERARKLALKNQQQKSSGPQAFALLATTAASTQTAYDQEHKVVITEMGEFVSGLHLDGYEDVFMDEYEVPGSSSQQVVDTSADEKPVKDEIVFRDEVAIGKGLSGALKLLKLQGILKESINECNDCNMDKKKSKPVGIDDDDDSLNAWFKDRFKDIEIVRRDEFGRIITNPLEAFLILCYNFHGKRQGKKKQEKRRKRYLEELRVKQILENSDSISLSVDKMRETQARLKRPYLVIDGVKHFLRIMREAEPGTSSTPKKPKT